MLRITVIAHPGAHRARVELQEDGTLDVWVRARAVEGQANAAIERAIATVLGLRPRQVNLLVGANARHKIVEVDVAGPEALHGRFLAHGLLVGTPPHDDC